MAAQSVPPVAMLELLPQTVVHQGHAAMSGSAGKLVQKVGWVVGGQKVDGEEWECLGGAG